MNPDVLLDASVLAAVLGLGLSAAAIWAARGVAPADGRGLVTVVGRLLDAGNVARARKLCLAAPRMAALAGVGAMLDAVTGGSTDASDEVGYRDGSSPAAASFRERLRRDFEAAARVPLRALAASGLLSLLGLAAAFGALALGLDGGAQQVEWAGALVATLGAQGWGLWSRGSARRRTRQVREGLIEPMARAWRSGVSEAAEARPDQRLLLVSEGGGPERVVSAPRGVVKLGSGPSCTVVLSHPSVARLHAVLEEQDGEVWVIDLGTGRPARVNGEAVARRLLRPGDVITLGEASVRVVEALTLDSAAPAPAQGSSSG